MTDTNKEELKTEEFDWKGMEKEWWGQFDTRSPEYNNPINIIDFIKSHCVPKKDYEKEIKEWKEYLDVSIKDTKYFETKLKETEKKLGAVRKWLEKEQGTLHPAQYGQLNKILEDKR